MPTHTEQGGRDLSDKRAGSWAPQTHEKDRSGKEEKGKNQPGARSVPHLGVDSNKVLKRGCEQSGRLNTDWALESIKESLSSFSV